MKAKHSLLVLSAFSCIFPSIHALSQTSSTGAHQRLQQSRDAGRDPLLSLNLNLDALARSNAPDRAQELFHRITALHDAGYYDVQPDIVSFNSVLKAWSKVSSPEKALEFWESVDNALITKNIRSYNTFLLALATVGMYEAATQLLEQMLWVNAAVRPDRISWNTVLLAHVNAAPRKSAVAEETEKLLKMMMDGETRFTTTTTARRKKKQSKAGGETNHRIHVPSVSVDPNYVPPTPDTTSFNIMISCIQHHNNDTLAAAKRADEWLRYMKEDANENVQPDAYTYAAVLKAWKQVSHPTAVQRVLELLREVNDDLHWNNENTQEQIILVTLVVQILCKNHQSAQAERILFESLAIPDATAYTSLMQGWAAELEASEALAATLRVWHRMRDIGLSPTPITYSVILRAASRVEGALAERILRHMSSPPSVIHYNIVLDGYAKINADAIAAERLWKSMDVPADIVTYNTILRAAANGYGAQRAECLRIGLAVMNTVIREEQCAIPTSITFDYYFKLLRRLVKDDRKRWELQKDGFAWCCEVGCLNKIVLRQITRSLSSDQQETLLGCDLPAFKIREAFSRNAM